MNHERDIETLLDRWFDEGPDEVPDRVLDIVRDRIERQSQRTEWRVAWRGPKANRFAVIGVAAALVALAAIAVSLAGKPPTIPPTNPPSPFVSPGPTATRTPTPSASSALRGAGLVVYEHWTPGLYFRLESLGSDGRGRELLPDLRGNQEAPAWSADGTRLLFAARDPQIADSQEMIWETDAAGVQPRLISTGCRPPACLDEYAPAYAPDGSVIAFVRFGGPLGGPPTTSVVTLRDMASGTVKELESTRIAFSDGFVDRPRWSPDGTALVYSKVLTDPTQKGAIDSIVMVVDRDGGNLRALTEPGFEAGDADWSPDGSHIAFAREPIHHWSGAGKGAGANQWIYTIAPDATGLTQLTSERSGGPSWTSGGSQILFSLIVTQTTASGDHAAPGVSVMSPDGSNQTPVARFSDCCRWYPVQQPMP